MVEEGDEIKSILTGYVYTVTDVSDDGEITASGPLGPITYVQEKNLENDIEEGRVEVL